METVCFKKAKPACRFNFGKVQNFAKVKPAKQYLLKTPNPAKAGAHRSTIVFDGGRQFLQFRLLAYHFLLGGQHFLRVLAHFLFLGVQFLSLLFGLYFQLHLFGNVLCEFQYFHYSAA